MKIPGRHILPLAAALVFTTTLPSCTKEAKKERALESALELFEKGSFSAAEIEYKNALKVEPGNPEAIKRLGMIRLLQGVDYEAAAMLSAAKDKLPKDDEVGVAFARALINLGFIPDSRKELLEVLDRMPSNGEALMLLAETSLTAEWMEQFDARLKASGKKTAATKIASALIELRRGAIESGSALVEEVLKSDSGMARAHALKASILSSKKLPDQALAELKTAADVAGSHSHESIAYAAMLMAQSRRDDAVAYLEKITAETPDFLTAWNMLGQIAYSEKKDDVATEYFAKVLSKNPFDQNSTLMQTEIWMRGKEPEKAVDLLEKYSSSIPSRPQIEMALAKCYLATDKAPKAAAALDRVLAVAPEFNEAGILRAQLHLQDGKTADAITLLEAIRVRAPNDAASRDLLIRAYRAAERKDDAIALLREKAGGDEAGPQSRVELGQLLGSQGKLQEARSIFEDAVETFSDSFAALSNLAAVDIREGKGDAALKRVEDFIISHPDSSEAYTFKASMELNLKKPELAERSLTKAVELKPDNAQAYALLLQLKSAPGQEKESLAILDRYLKAFPEDPQALVQRGYLLQQLGRNEEARAAFLALIKAKPEFAPGYNNLASLESEALNELESAATHARKARSLDPAHPAIADTLGWIEWQLGNYSAALPLITEAAAKMSDSPSVIYHLGKANYSMGQSAEAAAAFSKALESSSDFPEKADARKQLDLLSEAGKATLADLEKRIAENPKDVMSRLQFADLLARGDRPQEAVDAYQKAFDANPAITTALVGQTRLYGGPLKSPEKALQAATKARELAPRDPKVLAALGYAKLLAGDDGEAYGILKDAAAVLENDQAVVFDYARAAYSLGRVQEARTAMERVAKSDTSLGAEAKSFLLLTDAEAGKNPQIAAEVEKSLTKDPGNIAALMLRGSLETATGKSPEATYLEVLKLHPRFDPARVSLAALYLETPGKEEQAASLANEARSRMPEEPELTRILALANYRRGDFKYAAQLLAELSIKRALNPGELLALGLSYANSAQPEKAKETLDQAVKAGLSAAEAGQAKATLQKLETPEAK